MVAVALGAALLVLLELEKLGRSVLQNKPRHVGELRIEAGR